MNFGRRLGLIGALCASLVSLAVVGPAAASTLNSTEYPASIHGESTGAHKIVTQYATHTCNSVDFAGELVGSFSELTATLQDATCLGDFPDLKMNGCKFTFHFGVEQPGQEDSFIGTVDIGPESCGPITRNGYCKLSIPPQDDLSVTYENVGEGTGGTIEIGATITDLEYTQSGWSCATKTYSDGQYTGDWTVSGEVEGKGQGLSIESDSTDPRFALEMAPATLSGSQAAEDPIVLTTGAVSIQCASVDFTGEMPDESSSTIGLAPQFTECDSSVGTNAAFDVSSCLASFSIQDDGPYGGTGEFACDEGDAIKINMGLCVVTIPGQKGLTMPEVTNVGAVGTGHEVEIELDASGLEYSVENVFLCPLSPGAHEDGGLAGTLGLAAFDAEEDQVGLYATGHSG